MKRFKLARPGVLGADRLISFFLFSFFFYFLYPLTSDGVVVLQVQWPGAAIRVAPYLLYLSGEFLFHVSKLSCNLA